MNWINNTIKIYKELTTPFRCLNKETMENKEKKFDAVLDLTMCTTNKDIINTVKRDLNERENAKLRLLACAGGLASDSHAVKSKWYKRVIKTIASWFK